MHFGPFMSIEWDLHTHAETREIPPPLFNSILPFLKGIKRKEREKKKKNGCEIRFEVDLRVQGSRACDMTIKTQ